MTFKALISHGLHQIQRTFFPDLQYEAGPIPKSLIKLSYILQTIYSLNIDFPKRSWVGRPPNRRGSCLKIVRETFRLKNLRWQVERSFAWIKRKCRRIAVRWERKMSCWLAFTTLALIDYWLEILVR